MKLPGQGTDPILPNANRLGPLAGIVSRVAEKPTAPKPCRGYQLASAMHIMARVYINDAEDGLIAGSDAHRLPRVLFYDGRPTRHTRSRNRGSERRLSSPRSTLR